MDRLRNTIQSVVSSIGASKAFEDILRSLRNAQEITIGEVGDLAKVLLLQAIRAQTGKQVLLLVDTDAKREKLAQILYEIGEIDRFTLTRDTINTFLSASRSKSVVVATVDAILTKTVDPIEYGNKVISLTKNTRLPKNIADDLVEFGYQRVRTVYEAGEFSVRGDIIDIGMQDGVVRVELLGSVIDDMYYYDPRTTKKGQHKDTAVLYPLTIAKGTSRIFDYCDDRLIIIDGKDRVYAAILEHLSEDEVTVQRLMEERMSRHIRIYLEDFSVGDRGTDLSWHAPQGYGGDILRFVQHLRGDLKHKSIYIISEHAQQLRDSFLKSGISVGGTSGIHVQTGHISEGVNLVGLDSIIFSDKELFAKRQEARRKSKIDFAMLTSLKEGDFVVHIDHGIGCFRGFGELAVSGIKREYIFIEYRKGDKIYVPIDQADKVTKYITVGNQEPIMSSLSGGQWLKVRGKVQQHVEDIARELLEAQALREGEKPFRYIEDYDEQKQLADSFAYQVTPDQQKAIDAVLEDMAQAKPMDRLVVGDVGYGKTEVAIRAALRVVASGGQVALLVPTTILAEQHLQTFRNRLEPLGVRIESLSRFVTISDQRKVLERAQKGSVDIIIGTHRLLSSDVSFHKLMLVVIDEEQKFGVKHKERLKQLRAGVDILAMTATPIPRTLYLGLGGLKDISLIHTPPEGRMPIKTIVTKKDDAVIVEAIRREIKRDGQVYFVHNRVETIEAVAAKLRSLLPDVSIRVGHGKMKERDLASVMNDFADGTFQVLVSSTIIESGLDIARVNTLIVDKATHFGLSQLHQLRGRIGRGSMQAYAYFLYSSQDLKGDAGRRLTTIAQKGELGSGYELSLEDLDIRGSGNILGQEQHGSMQMVGVGYYLRLLEEAVERLTAGGKQPELRGEVKIELPVTAYIPDGFFKSNEEKVRAYQTLADIRDEEELNEYRVSIQNTESTMKFSREISMLFEILRLRIRARKASIVSIVAKDVPTMSGGKRKQIVIDFSHVLSKEQVVKMTAISGEWYFGNTQVKIYLDALGDRWFEKLLTLFQRLDIAT